MKKIARQASIKSAQTAVLAIMFSLSLAGAASAQSEMESKFSGVNIKNFGQMDERFFRGAQPKPEDINRLAALGINTIIDLRDDPKDFEKSAAEAAGMRYINIPMSDKKRPRDTQIEEFLKVVSDPATGKFFVHCAGGRHRTGVMGAVYRYNHYQWNYDQVYREMKDYDYYSRWGHGALKVYVQDYYQRLQTRGVEASSGASSNN
ncbi:MAG TPA: tyrosine-protein phosphatase [Blastocatellia bacterium]